MWLKLLATKVKKNCSDKCWQRREKTQAENKRSLLALRKLLYLARALQTKQGWLGNTYVAHAIIVALK
jgi:hypothetical protein